MYMYFETDEKLLKFPSKIILDKPGYLDLEFQITGFSVIRFHLSHTHIHSACLSCQFRFSKKALFFQKNYFVCLSHKPK